MDPSQFDSNQPAAAATFSLFAGGVGVGYPPDALPDAPLGARARTTRAYALEVHGGEVLSVRATSLGAHNGV